MDKEATTDFGEDTSTDQDELSRTSITRSLTVETFW